MGKQEYNSYIDIFKLESNIIMGFNLNMSLYVGVAISDTIRQPDTIRPEDKRVWVEIFDPPNRQPANPPISRVSIRVNPPGSRVDPPTRL